MKEVNTDAAASIMSTLRQCYDENRSTVTQVIVTEESNARGDAVEVVEEIEVEAKDLDVTPEIIDEDALRDDVSVDEIDEEADEVENVDQDGGLVVELVEKDNVKQIQKGQAAHQECKKQKNHALRMHIQCHKANVGSITFKEEVPSNFLINPSFHRVLKM
jgi:hypothetical protein